jgi:dephospho-CoA kinase
LPYVHDHVPAGRADPPELRAHPQAVPAYARFKRMLAETVDDLDVYTDVKDPIVDLVIVAAEEWATAVKWTC